MAGFGYRSRFFILYGLGVWPGVLAGMHLLSLYAEVPIIIAAIAESAIPLMVTRHFGFKGKLDSFQGALFFTAIIVVGPIISAVTGAMMMLSFIDSLSIPWINIVTLWWLGNSIGMLVFGGLLISLMQSPKILTTCRQTF